MLEELQHVSDTTPADGIIQEPTGVDSAAADLPAGGAPAHTPTGARGSGGDKETLDGALCTFGARPVYVTDRILRT